MAMTASFLLHALANFTLGLVLASILGPEAFGLFALTVAGAAAVVTPAVDWIRQAASRFYSERTRTETPQVRATLDFALLAAAAATVLAALACWAAGILSGRPDLAAAAPAALFALLGGAMDYLGALARARFRGGAYAALVAARDLPLLAGMAGVAALTGSPAATLAAGVATLCASALFGAWRLRDPGVRPVPDRALLRRYAAYGLPLVAAGAVAMIQAFANRAAIAGQFGLAEAGRFALAYDVAIRIFAVVGTALEVLLFQLAVRAEERHGAEEAHAQTARNMAATLAILCPAAVGFALCLPAFEAVFAPAAYRGSFAAYGLALTPGLLAWAAMTFGLTPVFQILGRTAAVAAPAALGLALNLAAGWALAGHFGPIGYAWAFSGGSAAAFLLFLALVLRAAPRMVPPARDALAIAVACAALAALGSALRGHWAAPVELAAIVVCGGALYLAVMTALDGAGFRRLAGRLLRPPQAVA